jgi:hypothetical protein
LTLQEYRAARVTPNGGAVTSAGSGKPCSSQSPGMVYAGLKMSRAGVQGGRGEEDRRGVGGCGCVCVWSAQGERGGGG